MAQNEAILQSILHQRGPQDVLRHKITNYSQKINANTKKTLTIYIELSIDLGKLG